MKLKEVMTEDVQCISPDTTLSEASRRMADLDVGFLPICENDRLSGVVTDRDIVIRGVAERKTGDTPVKDVCSSPVQFCYDDQDVSEAVRLMESKQIRRILVLDRNKRLCGVVSLGDLAVQTADERLSGEVLEKISA